MITPALFHFSEQDTIARFDPRPVARPTIRPAGMDWLNGPLVWAIDDWHQPLYLFPRDCPRILAWPTVATTREDRARHWPDEAVRMIACVEARWLERLASVTIFRYRLPAAGFVTLDDAGMWVSRRTIVPDAVEALQELPAQLARYDVALHLVSDLRPLARLWKTSLHVSGIRLRNAAAGWP